MSSKKIYRMVLAAMFLALAMVLPLVTAQIPEIGKALCPMHIPVILCGFFCGMWYGLGIGLVAPLLRFAIFGMPVLMPTGIAMCFELAAYGLLAGLFYKLLPKKRIYIYVTLVLSMLIGRVIWGIARVALLGIAGAEFSWQIFITEGFVRAVPGIIAQLVLIPILVMILNRFTYRDK